MPVTITTHGPLVLRRLAREDLHGLAEVLPAALALGGDVEAWTGAGPA